MVGACSAPRFLQIPKAQEKQGFQENPTPVGDPVRDGHPRLAMVFAPDGWRALSWWAEHSPTRNELYRLVGRRQIVAEEPEVSGFDAWQADGNPDPEPELTAAGTWA